MTSFLLKAPAGSAGHVTRMEDSTIESGYFAGAAFPTAFGQPVKVDANGKFVLMGAGSAAADFYGVLVREVPSVSGSATANSFADGIPNPKSFHGIMTRGYAAVVCGVGTPVRDGAVYVRIVDGGAGKPVGQYEATADGANSVLVPELIWASNGKDAANIAELRVAR